MFAAHTRFSSIDQRKPEDEAAYMTQKTAVERSGLIIVQVSERRYVISKTNGYGASRPIDGQWYGHVTTTAITMPMSFEAATKLYARWVENPNEVPGHAWTTTEEKRLAVRYSH